MNNDQKIGILDIGSNSIRFIVFDVSVMPPSKIYNEKTICGLGADLSTTGLLHPPAVEEAMEALHTYKNEADKMGLGALLCIGTAALREAEDAQKFCRQVYDKTGIQIKIISGEEEAHYAARSVLLSNPIANGVVADLGGGSLELAEIGDGQVGETVSFPLGALRMKAIEDDAERAQTLSGYFSNLSRPLTHFENFYMMGGSWRALARAYATAIGHGSKIDGSDIDLTDYTIDPAEFTLFLESIRQRSEQNLIIGFGVEPRRASLIPVAAEIMISYLRHVDCERIYPSTCSLLEGVLDAHMHSDFAQPEFEIEHS